MILIVGLAFHAPLEWPVMHSNWANNVLLFSYQMQWVKTLRVHLIEWSHDDDFVQGIEWIGDKKKLFSKLKSQWN